MPAAKWVVRGVGLTMLWCAACGGDGEAIQGGGGMGAPVLTAGSGAVAGQGAGTSAAGMSAAGNAAVSGGAGAAGQAAAGMGAAVGTAGAAGTAAGSGGSSAGVGGGAGAAAGSGGVAGGAGAAGTAAPPTEKFSFFVTSLKGMQDLSDNDQGFGGDLRYGQANGLAGADKICTDLAELSLAGSGAKGWRAFLSTAKGGANDGPVHAKDRIGAGPWYDRKGRLVAMNLTNLLQSRPSGADPAIINDLPNEFGIPNRTDTVAGMDDNHDTVTGTNMQGMYDGTTTCEDWTSTAATSSGAAGSGGRGGGGRGNGPRLGHSWPAGSGMSWMTAHTAPGCAPSVSLVQMGGGTGTGIGNGGGYGGIYCFALTP